MVGPLLFGRSKRFGMINANIVFILFIVIFGMIGTMRGWVREIIVTASLVLALFVLNQFGDKWNGIISGVAPAHSFEQWLLRAAPLFLITFFGYLGPAVVRSRFEQNTRGKLEQGILAFIIGSLNGYIIFSTMAYIAWKALLLDNPPASPGQSPAFSVPIGGWNEIFFIKNAAMSVLSGSTLVIVLIAVFLFVIVVIV
jgi:uncharacterized membrane protein required for colicin V production